MEFKGTKGKWKAIHNGYFYDIKSDGHSLASTQSNVYLGIDAEQQRANAKIISKAPEMLEMIEELVHIFSDTNNSTDELELVNQAKDLIKRAKL